MNYNKLNKDFIECTNLKMHTEYNMPENYSTEFISQEELDYHINFYKNNGLGWYLADTGVTTMKPVHLFKDMFNVCK